jgi:hypothetical protein
MIVKGNNFLEFFAHFFAVNGIFAFFNQFLILLERKSVAFSDFF